MFKELLSQGMLIVFKQQKACNLMVDKQFSKYMYLPVPFLKAMEEEEVEDSLGSLHMTEVITILTNILLVYLKEMKR